MPILSSYMRVFTVPQMFTTYLPLLGIEISLLKAFVFIAKRPSA